MLFPSNPAASRVFIDTLRSNDNQLSQHPEDFELYRLGTFQADSGNLEVLSTPERVVTGAEYLSNLRSPDSDGE